MDILATTLSLAFLMAVAYRGYKQLGVDPTGCPIDVAIATWDWGSYLAGGALENARTTKYALTSKTHAHTARTYQRRISFPP